MAGSKDPANEGPPVEMPDIRAATRGPQRARLVLEWREGEGGEWSHSAQTGWAMLDGCWVHWLDDEFDEWQTWAAQSVVCLDWSVA